MINPTPNKVLDILRKLPPKDRLWVISLALAELEKNLSAKPQPLKSLRGLWKDLRPSISAEEIDAARKEMWKDFPREDMA